MRVVSSVIMGVLVLAFIGCKKEEVDPRLMEMSGYWVHPVQEETLIYRYTKASGFDDQSSGIHLASNGAARYRTIYGFCATPPVTYTTYTGYWKRDQDQLTLMIKFDRQWQKMRYQILEVNQHEILLWRYADLFLTGEEGDGFEEYTH